MLDWIKENSTAFSIAVIFHAIFFGALFVNWQADQPKKIVMEQGDVIQVTSVDANSFDAEIKKIEEKKQARKNLEKKRQAREERRLKELKEKKKQKKAEQLKRKKAAEAKQKKEAKKKAEQKKARKLAKKEAAEEKQKKEARRKEELKRKDQQKKAEEARKKVEEKKRLKEEKKHQEAERKRKAEEKKKRLAEEKRQQERVNAERKRLSKGIINRHVAMIAQKIERNWRQPLDAPNNLKCKIDIILLPSGNVVSVTIVESSGNPSFDRSVETAVRKASPLPVPTDSVIFKQFEVMRLRFEPGH